MLNDAFGSFNSSLSIPRSRIHLLYNDRSENSPNSPKTDSFRNKFNFPEVTDNINLMSLEKLDPGSPETWPEKSKHNITSTSFVRQFLTYCRCVTHDDSLPFSILQYRASMSSPSWTPLPAETKYHHGRMASRRKISIPCTVSNTRTIPRPFNFSIEL